jgi:hypothetical protein
MTIFSQRELFNGARLEGFIIAMSLGSITADFVGVLQLAHVLLDVRLHLVLFFFILSDGQGQQNMPNKVKTLTQTAGRQAAIAGAGCFIKRSLFRMVQKMIPDNDEYSQFYFHVLYAHKLFNRYNFSSCIFYFEALDHWLFNKV